MDKEKLLQLLQAMEENAFFLCKDSQRDRKSALKNKYSGEYFTLNTIRCAILDEDFFNKLFNIYCREDAKK